MSTKRRECKIITDSDLFYNFEKANYKLCQRSKDTSDQIVKKGIMMLDRITATYLDSKKLTNCTASFGVSFSLQQNNNLPLLINKKQLIAEEKHHENEVHDQVTFGFSNVKQQQNNHIKPKYPDKRFSEADQLRESLKKIHISDDDDIEEELPQNELTQEIIRQLQNKTLSQIVQKSRIKLEQKIQRLGYKQKEASSDSSYPITDYQSNQSSNDNDYDEQYRDSSLPENIMNNLNKTSSQQIINSKVTFQTSKLMNSPKKSKSTKKRLFIRDKKVPRWAIDLERIYSVVDDQTQDFKFNPLNIYGLCVAEKLDTNVIFNKEQVYFRGSSAKWNRNPFDQFQTF